MESRAGLPAIPTGTVMGICNFCDSELNQSDAECSTCGFNPSSETFNVVYAQKYYNDTIKKDWKKGIRFVYKLNKYLIEKKGFASTNPEKGGWSITKTAKLLGKSLAVISQQIKLAEELPNYPELEDSRSSNIAIQRLKVIKSEGITVNIQSEIDLQKCIVAQWDNLFNGWQLLSNDDGFDIKEIGILDFLAKHVSEDERYLVIELKKDQSSDSTVGQILRYMGWVKTKLAGGKGKVEGLIISRSYDLNIKYALKYTQNIMLKFWRIQGNGLTIVTEVDDLLEKINQFTPEQKNKLLIKLEKGSENEGESLKSQSN